MKKNIVSIVILALSVANLVLSALLIFTFMPQAKKTDKLVTEICSVLKIELDSSGVKDKVEEENIRDVIFTGSRDDVENIIPSCDVLVLPSFSESFGLVLIEALACGKPVIGSNVGGITEIINDDVGLLVDPNKIPSIASAIDNIVNDEDLRLVLSLNARNRAMDFSKVTIPYEELK